MKIGLDARFWDETGIGRVTRNSIQELAKLDSQNNYIVYVLKNTNIGIFLPANFTVKRVAIPWFTFKEQLVFPLILYRDKLDLLLGFNFQIPILYFKKMFVVIHDLTPLKIKSGRMSTHSYPIYTLKRFAAYLNFYATLLKAKKIFCVSNYTLNQIIATFKLSPKKLTIIPVALDDAFKKPAPASPRAVLAKYDIHKPYLFYIGNAHLHKNLGRLILAFGDVLKTFPNLTLVLAGKHDYFYKRLKQEASAYPYYYKISFPGFIADEDLATLYAEAEALVIPSLMEGFGIQLLEAFYCKTKVVCSDVTSLPEVGGNIPYYFSPLDVKAMALAIETCLTDRDPKRLQAGSARVKQFSWQDNAKIILHEITKLKL